MRDATVNDLLQMLDEHSLELERKLNIEPIQFSFPTDGKGLRIKVSVLPKNVQNVPKFIDCNLFGEDIRIFLEVKGDYQDYRPLSSLNKAAGFKSTSSY